MKEQRSERTEELARYIIQYKATVRQAAGVFGLSKSTVHKDVTQRLRQSHPGLFAEVRDVLEENKAQRHLRGGEATRRKYKGEG